MNIPPVKVNQESGKKIYYQGRNGFMVDDEYVKSKSQSIL